MVYRELGEGSHPPCECRRALAIPLAVAVHLSRVLSIGEGLLHHVRHPAWRNFRVSDTPCLEELPTPAAHYSPRRFVRCPAELPENLPGGKIESGKNPMLVSPGLPEGLRRSWPSMHPAKSTMLGSQRRTIQRHGGPTRPPNSRTKPLATSNQNSRP